MIAIVKIGRSNTLIAIGMVTLKILCLKQTTLLIAIWRASPKMSRYEELREATARDIKRESHPNQASFKFPSEE